MSFRGYIEAGDEGPIVGWAVAEDGAGCELAMTVNGEAPVAVASDLARPDLVRLGVSTGTGGFRVDPAPYLKPGKNRIELRYPDGKDLPGSPTTRFVETPAETPHSYRGYVERREAMVSGWAVTEDGLPCRLVAEVNGRRVAETVSDHPRPDLARSQLSRGEGGFIFDLGEFLADDANAIDILLPGGEHVRGSPFHFPPEDEVPKNVPFAATEPLQPEMPEIESDAASNVTAIAPRANDKKPEMPSLTELDELSLDDLSLAVAAGFITVSPPRPIAEAPEEPEQAAPPPQPQPEPEPQAAKRSLFDRLFRRVER
ncbi:MAG: hypothetical protein WDN44_05275 [Sphingomonas sp.]